MDTESLISVESQQNVNEMENVGVTREYMKFFPTFMNILNTLTGAEVLSVSNSMCLIGFVYSIILMVFTTVLSYLCTIIVLKIRGKVNAESINELATKIIGPWGGTVYSVLTLCFTFSCQIAYLFIGAESVLNWADLLGMHTWQKGIKRSLVVLVYSLVLPVLLTFPKELKILSIVSTSAILCQVLYVSGMIYEAIRYIPTQGINPTCERFKFGIEFFNAFAIYSMLYAFPSVFLPLVRNYNPDIRSRYRLIGASFVGCFTLTIIPGVIGYLIFGVDTNQIVISSFDSHDIFMQVVRVGFFIVVNASFAVNGINVIQDISSLVFKQQNPSKLSFGRRAIVLLITNVPPVLCAMFLPEIRPMFEIGGAFGGCLSNFFVPPVLYIVLNRSKGVGITNIAMGLFALFGLVSAGIATYQAVVDAMDPNN